MSHTPIQDMPAAAKDYGKQLQPDESLLDKLDQLNSMIDNLGICMLTTRRADGKLVSRPMTISGRRRGVDLVLFMHAQGHKADEIHADAHVNLSFLKPDKGDWVSISGLATVRTPSDPTGTGAPPTDKTSAEYASLVHEHWSGDVAAWFKNLEGKDPAEDGRVGVAVVRAISAQYGQAQGGMTQLFDRAYSYVTGSALPTRHVETRCLATPDLDAARILASASAKEAHRALDAEHQHFSTIHQPTPTTVQPIPVGVAAKRAAAVSLGSGTDTFDDGQGAQVEGATAVGYEGPEGHARIVRTPQGEGVKPSSVSAGYLGPQTDAKLRTSLEHSAGIHEHGKAEE